jgi:hypothetical protein
LALLCRLDQPDNAGIGAVRRAAACAQIERFARIHRAAHHVVSLRQTNGHRLARQCRLIDQRRVTCHRAVDGCHFAPTDQQQIAWFDTIKGNILQCAIRISRGGSGDPRQQGAHLASRAACGEAFQIGSARIHHRHDGCGQRFAEHERGRHRQGRDDIETDISVPKTAHDLDQERGKDRHDTDRPHKIR